MLASYCGICGLQFQPNDTFCARCGTPRDGNMADPTALHISVPNAPSTFRSGLQTICLNCGQPRPPNVFPCSFCNSSVPTIQVQGKSIAQQMATNTPTPPLIIKDPTSQQIYDAMVGTVNPYGHGLWGDLIVDGSKKNVWDFPKKEGAPGNLIVYNAGLLTTLSLQGMHAISGIACQDFTYQAAITFPSTFGNGGLAFRMDEGECHLVGLSRSWERYNSGVGQLLETSVLVSISPSNSVGGSSKEILYSDDNVDDKAPSQGRNTRLLAVVAQGITLDLYIDLIHIARFDSLFVNNGSIGIWNGYDKFIPSEFRHTKLWIKRS